MASQSHPYTRSDMHIGHALREARLDRELSEAQLADALNLKTDYVTAIEALDRDSLPSIGYVLGYVRAYASLVGINPTEAVARFKADSEVPDNLGMRDRPHFVPRRRVKLPRGFVAALSVVGSAAVLAFWYGSNTDVIADERSGINIPAVTSQPAAPAATPANILTLKTTGPSWVQVKDPQGRVLLSRIMVAGETWPSEQGARLVVSARDGGVVDLYKGDERLGAMGERGVSFTGKPLDPATIIPALADIPLTADELTDVQISTPQ